MGVMRFIFHPEKLLDGWPEVFRAYIGGMEGRVFPTRVEVDGNVLLCRRQSSESGKLHVSWPVAGSGRPTINTTSLPERDEPYLLAVELARGKISQLRDQVGAWEVAGMTIPDDFAPLHKDAYRQFSQSVANLDNLARATELANQAIEKAFAAGDLLAKAYTQQRLAARRQRSHSLPASLGCNLGQALPDDAGTEHFCNAFNEAAVPIEWRHIEPVEGEYDWQLYDQQVEWCQQNKLLVTGGPLLDMSPGGLPEWLWQWEHDFHNLQSFVTNFVQTAISRYVGKIRNWEVSARANTGGALALSEENRLTLVASTIEAARKVDEEVQLTIRVDQPWSEYLARGQHRLNPLQFVDALARSGVGLSGINLEIAVGYRPRSTGSRDLLDFSQQIDHWSNLGVPLHVTLAFPSSDETDPELTSDLEVDAPQWKDGWSEMAQAEWVDQYVPILMAKQTVVGIYWTHFTDQSPHFFPNAGLMRRDNTPKPALDRIIQYRRTYWKSDREA